MSTEMADNSLSDILRRDKDILKGFLIKLNVELDTNLYDLNKYDTLDSTNPKPKKKRKPNTAEQTMEIETSIYYALFKK